MVRSASHAVRFLAILCVPAFAACSGGGAPPVTQTANAAGYTPFGLAAKPLVATAQLDRLYAVDAGGFPPTGPVFIFNEYGSHQKAFAHFGTFNSSYAVKAGADGKIYVTDGGTSPYDGKLYVYAEADGAPILTIDDDGGLPADVAVAADGTIYLANAYEVQACNGGGDVRVYAKGQTSPAYTICDSGIGQPYSQLNGIALDSKGDVFVTWESGTNTYGRVREFTPGPNYTGHFLPHVFKYPFGIAVDAAGNVAVADAKVPAVEVLAWGSATPKYTLAQTGDPTGIAFDSSGTRLFVADALANQIDVYEFPGGTLVNTIPFPGQQVDGIAVGPPFRGL
jgi:DNA-binding beta-propeller fold protein YncE